MPSTPAQLFKAARNVIDTLMKEQVAAKAVKLEGVKNAAGKEVVRWAGEVPTETLRQKMFGSAVKLRGGEVVDVDSPEQIQAMLTRLGVATPDEAVEHIEQAGFNLGGTFITEEEAEMVKNWFGDFGKLKNVRIVGPQLGERGQVEHVSWLNRKPEKKIYPGMGPKDTGWMIDK